MYSKHKDLLNHKACGDTVLHSFIHQPDTSLHCKTMNTEQMHHAVCILSPIITCRVTILIVPTHGYTCTMVITEVTETNASLI